MTTMNRRHLGLAAIVLVGLSSCGAVPASDERPVNPAPTLGAATVPDSTVAPSTTPPATVPASTAAPTTTPIGTSSTTAADLLTLAPDGLGASVPFGQEAEGALSYLTARLGAPNADSGWVPAPSSPFGVCPGADVRGVRWGPLQVLFGDEGTPTRHVFTYVYATSLLQPGETVGYSAELQTAAGIGLGSSIADLKASYPEVVVTADVYGPTFATAALGGVSGTLSSENIDGFVTSIIGGSYCGE